MVHEYGIDVSLQQQISLLPESRSHGARTQNRVCCDSTHRSGARDASPIRGVSAPDRPSSRHTEVRNQI